MKLSVIALLILSLAGTAGADDKVFQDLVSANGYAVSAAEVPEPNSPAIIYSDGNESGKLIVKEFPPDNDAPGYKPSADRTVAALPGNVMAFLDVIAYSEGTQAYGPEDGYNVMFTYKMFSDYSRHPRIINCGGGWCSDAAGRYQFLFQTWEGVRQELNLPDFSSRNQDLGCLELIRRRWAYEDVENSSDYNRFVSAIYKCNKEWASFPGSPYGQPRRSMVDLWSHYQQFRKSYPW